MSNYGFFASVYDELTVNVEYKKRAEYIISLLKRNGISGGILLDLACGTGTLSKFLADAGFDMICADNSPAMLNIAKEKVPSALILNQDMTKLDLYGTIDACVCSLDSVNHLTKIGDVRKAFDKVSLFTRPGGVFVFDINSLYKHREILADNTFIYDTEKAYCIWQNSLNKKTDTVSIHLDIFTLDENGRYIRNQEDFSERAYDINDIKQWLEYSGFDVTGIYGELSYEKPEEKSQRIYFTAIKK